MPKALSQRKFTKRNDIVEKKITCHIKCVAYDFILTSNGEILDSNGTQIFQEFEYIEFIPCDIQFDSASCVMLVKYVYSDIMKPRGVKRVVIFKPDMQSLKNIEWRKVQGIHLFDPCKRVVADYNILPNGILVLTHVNMYRVNRCFIQFQFTNAVTSEEYAKFDFTHDIHNVKNISDVTSIEMLNNVVVVKFNKLMYTLSCDDAPKIEIRQIHFKKIMN